MSGEQTKDHRSPVEKENDEPSIVAPVLLLCEGAGDAAFFRHVLDSYEITGFQVAFPPRDNPGFDGFAPYLSGMPIRRGYEDLKHIVIVADCDDNAAERFKKVIEVITVSNLTAPKEARRPSKGTPAVTVVLLPSNEEPGNLETLLLKTLKPHDKAACWDKYFECLKMDDLRPGVVSKKKAATIIATANNSNPTCTLHYLWSEKNRKYNPFSIEHDAIKELAAVLRGLAALPDTPPNRTAVLPPA
jgi:hypothetical protein